MCDSCVGAEEGGAVKMLEDPLMHTATAEILVGDRPRFEIQRDIKAKVRCKGCKLRTAVKLLPGLDHLAS